MRRQLDPNGYSMSGLQHTVMHLLDELIGRTTYNYPYGTGALFNRAYYMPPNHVAFINSFRIHPHVRTMVEDKKAPVEAVLAYNRLVGAWSGDNSWMNKHYMKATGFLTGMRGTGGTTSGGALLSEIEGGGGGEDDLCKLVDKVAIAKYVDYAVGKGLTGSKSDRTALYRLKTTRADVLLHDDDSHDCAKGPLPPRASWYVRDSGQESWTILRKIQLHEVGSRHPSTFHRNTGLRLLPADSHIRCASQGLATPSRCTYRTARAT